MRLKIEGDVTVDRVAAVLRDLMERASGAHHLTGVNLYFTVRDQRDTPIDFHNEEGEVIETLVWREPRRKVPLRKQKPKLKIVKSGNEGGAESQDASVVGKVG